MDWTLQLVGILAEIFIFAVGLIIVAVTVMYIVEGDAGSGFDNIPESVYWAIVTMTTVGYGDLAPTTVLGKVIASALMICGYSIIAVPTGIVGVELARASKDLSVSTQACPSCGADGHAPDASYCKHCGAGLHPERR